ncbi:putative NAD(P)-binding domain-containing protein [Seiridium cardinale]
MELLVVNEHCADSGVISDEELADEFADEFEVESKAVTPATIMKAVKTIQNCVLHMLGPLSSRADYLESKAKLTKCKSSSRGHKWGVTDGMDMERVASEICDPHITVGSERGPEQYRGQCSSQSVELSTKPIVQSIEDATTSKFVYRLTNVQPKVVVWAAGAGGPGGDERTVTVDHGGAIKMMDACAEAEVERFLP